MKTIPLTQGKFTIVDDEDFESLIKLKWQYAKRGENGYARCVMIDKNGAKIKMYMHRLIINPDKQSVIDHIDMDGLNNQKTNLRICTRQQNLCNNRKHRGTSKYKGVYFRGGEYGHNKWRSCISHNNKTVHIGSFATQEEAALARDMAAIKLRGDFASLNHRSNLSGLSTF